MDLAIGVLRELEANPYIWNRALQEPRSVGPEVLEFALKTTQERNPLVGPRYRQPQVQQFGRPELEARAFSTEISFENPARKKPEPQKPEPQKLDAQKVGTADD